MRPEHPVALITGASLGIGEATARILAREGYSLALGARDHDKVNALAAELARLHGIRAWSAPLDVRSSESVIAFVDGATAALGNIHVVIPNAGLAKGTDRLDAVQEADWKVMIDTNVEGVLRTIRACLPRIREAGWGHVVFMGSIAGSGVYEGGGIYCGTKHMLTALSRTLRMELLGEPIRVTRIDPGMVETNFSVTRLGSRDAADAVYRGVEPLTADDIAECVRWVLALPDHVNIDEIVVKPRDQAAFHRVNRRSEG